MLAVATLSGLTLTGCGTGGETANSGKRGTRHTSPEPGKTSPRTRPRGVPSIIFETPGDEGAKSTFTALVRVTGVKLSEAAIGKRNVSGQGHLHFILDGGKYDSPTYSSAAPELFRKEHSVGKFSPSGEPSMTYRNIPPGEHTLEAVLVHNNNRGKKYVASTGFPIKP
jgi:hypothetical protein